MFQAGWNGMQSVSKFAQSSAVESLRKTELPGVVGL